MLNIIEKIKRKLHKYTIEKLNDYYELKHAKYGNLKLYSGHYRIRNRNYYGMHEEKDLVSFIDMLPSNTVMWDVGANIGYFSLYAASKGIRVLALEPDQLTCGTLNKNIYLNNLSNKVLAIPIALNSENKISSFFMRNFLPANAYNTFDRNKNEWGDNFTPEFIQGAIGMKADDITFDSNFSHFLEPDFIKIDVDGNEYKVLSGMKKILNKVKYLCIELSSTHPEYDSIQELLRGYNFEEIKDERYVDKRRLKNGMRNIYYSRI